MAQTPKILGQVACAIAATDYVLYTAPQGGSAVLSTVFACETGGVAANFTIAVWPAGAKTADVKYYLYRNCPFLAASDTAAITAGITLGPGDNIRVQGSTTTVVFSAFGVENTP